MKSPSIAIVLAFLFLCAAALPAAAGGALPPLPVAYGVAMPSLQRVLNRYPDTIDESTPGEKVETYEHVTESDYAVFGEALEASGCVVQDYTYENGLLRMIIGKEGKTLLFEYDVLHERARLVYADGAYDEAVDWAESEYQRGKALLAAGSYQQAYLVFEDIQGYKDVDSLLANDHNLAAAAARNAKYNVGNYVTFGHYPQTEVGDDSTPIEWLVLAREGNKALLLSRYGLDAKPYNTTKASITWENCTLRTWLNGEFLSKAFTEEEQASILLTEVDNSSGQGYSEWNATSENSTWDKIFLLSYAEGNKYLGVSYENDKNIESRVAPTDYANEKRAYTAGVYRTAEDLAGVWWWLRSHGSKQDFASFVDYDGSLFCGDVSDASGYVRPALWIDIDANNPVSGKTDATPMPRLTATSRPHATATPHVTESPKKLSKNLKYQ